MSPQQGSLSRNTPLSRHSLRWRLPVLFGAIVVVVLATFLWATHREVERTLVGAGVKRAGAAAEQIAGMLAGSVENVMEQTTRMADHPAVRAYLENPTDETRAAARKVLLPTTATALRRTELWGADGSLALEIASSPADSVTGLKSYPRSQRATRAGVSTIQRSGEWNFFHVTVAIGADSTRPLGYLRRYGRITSTSGGAVRRLLGDGALVKVGSTTAPVWTDFFSIVDPPPAYQARSAPGVTRAADGVRWVADTAVIRGTPWVTWVGFPRALMLEPAKPFMQRMLLVALLFAISSLIVGWVAADRLVLRRVYPVIGATRRFAAGDRSARVGLRSARPDELSELATAFDQMADSVQRSEDEVRDLNAQLEGRVQQRTAQLEALNKELESFSYSVSHDLRSPLRSVDGFSQALLEDYADQLDDTARDYLRRIRAAAQRMGSLIDDLLTLSRISRKKLDREPVDLSALARSVTQELREQDPERSVEVKVQPGLYADGDAGLLRVLMANLLGNAWKFTARQPNPVIEFGAAGHNGERSFFVRDNGVGFDMTYADKLFGAFQRMHNTEEFEGTGIGLATVQRVLTRHGGRAWAEAAVNRGATFYFTI